LLTQPASPVATLVLASPIEDPGGVFYPTKGDQGWGVAMDEAMRLLSDAFQGVAPVDLSPNNLFLASLDGKAPLLEKAMSCRLPGTRQFALLPLADATVVPVAEKLGFPSVVLPAFHGGLIESPSGEKILSRVLLNQPVSDDRLLQLADEAISYASAAWQVPAPAQSVIPPSALRAGISPSCPQVAAQLWGAVQNYNR
jgi:hypothetical protein